MKLGTKTTLGVATPVAALGNTADPSLATIIGWQPAVVKISPRTSVVLGAATINVQISAFGERQCFPLPNDVLTDHCDLPAGMWGSCHLVHANAATSAILLGGRARFNGDIPDVISRSVLLDASDAECWNGFTKSPAASSEPSRGLEEFQPLDRYRRLDPRTIEVQSDVPSFSDQIRVITECCPDDQVCN